MRRKTNAVVVAVFEDKARYRAVRVLEMVDVVEVLFRYLDLLKKNIWIDMSD